MNTPKIVCDVRAYIHLSSERMLLLLSSKYAIHTTTLWEKLSQKIKWTVLWGKANAKITHIGYTKYKTCLYTIPWYLLVSSKVSTYSIRFIWWKYSTLGPYLTNKSPTYFRLSKFAWSIKKLSSSTLRVCALVDQRSLRGSLRCVSTFPP